jgi:hypothetical protein
MSLELNGLQILKNVGLVAAYGVLTFSSQSSSEFNGSSLNMPVPIIYEPLYTYIYDGNDLSSTLMKNGNQMGDIIDDNNKEFTTDGKKVNVTLKITKISKHISSFDFEDEYEEM